MNKWTHANDKNSALHDAGGALLAKLVRRPGAWFAQWCNGMRWDVRDIAPLIPSGKSSSRTFATRTAAMQAVEAALAGGGMSPAQRKEKERADRLALGLRRRELYAHDEDWPKLREMADKMARRRGA